MFCSFRDDYTIKLIDIETKQCIQTYEGHTHLVHCLKQAADNRLISASWSMDDSIKIWNIETGECIKTIDEASRGIHIVSNDTFLSHSINEACIIYLT
jgi:WD40 repeat protein